MSALVKIQINHDELSISLKFGAKISRARKPSEHQRTRNPRWRLILPPLVVESLFITIHLSIYQS